MQAKLTFKRGVHTVAELRGDADQITTQELLDMEQAINERVPTVRCHAELVEDQPATPARSTFVTNPKQ